jgi:branched-chain amino acid aminotransferase
MAIQATEKIWHNGKLIPWKDAQIHVMAHVVNYGSSVFEGIRCYAPAGKPAIFRLRDHMQRLIDSAKIYRIEIDYNLDQLCAAALEIVSANGVWPCYLRPIVMRGYGEAGVNPFNSPTEVYMTNYPWGKYLGHGDVTEGVDACVSSWSRIAPNTIRGNYLQSSRAKLV